MAKNITIREGDTSKQFTAKKLKMNLVGGGTANFVPEDEVLDYVNLKDHTFNQSGTFNPSQFNCDGFRQVKIDIPADVKEKAITANGEYNAADDNVLGYSKVTVNVAGSGGGGPFTVLFLDQNDNVLEKVDNVPYGGGATYSGILPKINAMRFAGWNPSPSNVMQNLNCYPRFENIIYDENQIVDDWVTIANNCRRDKDYYPTGSWKLMEFRQYEDSGSTIDNGFVRMQLVAKGVDPLEGETGYANTTWVAMDLCKVTHYMNLAQRPGQGWYTEDLSVDSMRNYLNYTFLLNAFPEELINYLRPVIKYSASSYNGTWFPDYPTVDKIWIPSNKEVTGYSDYEQKGTFYDIAFGENGEASQTKRVKRKYDGTLSSWTTRTLQNVGWGGYRNVSTNGALNYYNAEPYQWGVLIGFCI